MTGKGRFDLVVVDDPAPGPADAVVAIARCGICGSDIHAYREGWPYSPAVCGHEWVGTVVEVGADVSGDLVTEGMRVVGGQAPGCGMCRECRADLAQFCRTAISQASGAEAPTSGGFAPYLTLRANRLVPLPESLTAEDGALVEPVSVALHAVRRSRLAAGDVVCVVGCGPIGLLVIQCARLAGAGTVIAVEPHEGRRRLARRLGADVAVAPGPDLRAAIDDATDGLRADLAFDCAGIPDTLQKSVDMVRPGGSVRMVGVSGNMATVKPMRWMMKEIGVDASLGFHLHEMAVAARLVANGRIRTDGMITGTVTLDELPSTIEGLAERRLDAVKLLVDPTAG
ncbi:MAG: zinc-binding dehydrogenase [Acidimicrobiia bacterium]|nr:zinc-binding dehydrogenase [Acidimicrobiia bacterium]